MKHGAPIIVKRYGPIMGRLDGPRKLTTAYFAWSVFEALEWCRHEQEHARRAAERGAWWARSTVLFIQARHAPAARSKSGGRPRWTITDASDSKNDN